MIALQEGDKAPWPGELMGIELAIQMGHCTSHCDERISYAIEREQELAAAAVDEQKKLHALDVQNLTAELSHVQSQLEAAAKVADEDKPPFFARPWFVAPVCFALGVGATVWIYSSKH